MGFIQSELASNIAGYASIGCWIAVFFPQLWANHKRKSCESLSTAFIWIWLAGDVLNLAGASLQNLLFTMIALAVYYVVIDIVILGQVYYYRKLSREHPQDELVGETTTLLSPGQRRRPSTIPVPEQKEKTELNLVFVLKYFVSFVVVFMIGYLTYYLSTAEQGIRKGESIFATTTTTSLFGFRILRDVGARSPYVALLAQALGWGSALLYLGSRIPQIIKNYQNKSCDGLSLAMFCFSVAGNVTYVMSILFRSVEYEYLVINLPWIIGSAGTLFFDFTIFGQFYAYRNSKPFSQIMASEIIV